MKEAVLHRLLFLFGWTYIDSRVKMVLGELLNRCILLGAIILNLLSQRVKHKVFGTGTVVNQASNMITVDFPAKTCKFQVPDCFTKGFLTPEDANIIATMKAEEEAAKAAAEAAKRAAEEKKAAEEQAKLDALKEKAGVKTPSSIKTAKPIERVPGKSMVFLVFQGSTYEEERKGQFIWAPQYTKSGATCHHWDRLMDVREGDVIFHCSNGYIQAISRAVGPCKNCLRPVQNTSDVDWTQWEKEGRSVQCKYHPLVKPLKHGDYKEVITKYSGVKYSPFDKDGNGNMGYLFNLEPELAAFFIKKAAEKNHELFDLSFLQFLLVK